MPADPGDPVSIVIERMLRSLGERGTLASPALAPVVRAVPPLDEVAFDTALGVFHRVYRHAFRPVLASEAEEAHRDAVREGLEAFLGTYVEQVTR